MGLIDEKRDIFTQIGALTSIAGEVDVPEPTNSISSINNTKEIVPFLLDMLTVLVGSEVLQTTLGDVMTVYIRNVEPSLKTALKTQLGDFNTNQSLPSAFINSGYDFQMKNLDVFQKLKNDPASQVGSLLYNPSVNDFDRKMYEALTAPGSDITFNNVIFNYDDDFDTVNIKPADSGQTIGDFTNDYINGITIINENEFVSNFIDQLFGTVTTNENKTLNTIIAEEKYSATIQKIVDEEEELDLTNSEINTIQRLSQNKLDGLEYYDVGCGQIPNNVTLNNLQGLISGTTGNSNPLSVGSAYLNTLMEGFTDAGDGTTIPSDRATENQQAVKDGFFKRIINAIVNILVTAVTSPPQIRALLGLLSGFKNNDTPQLGDPIDDLKNNRNLANCLAKSARTTINEFLFNLVKKELIQLIIPISKIILKEKINQYLGIIQSLIRLT